MKIKAIIKRPDEEFGHMTNISEKLENLQNTVGGYIECVSPDPRIVIICNEEGKLIGMEQNMHLQMVMDAMPDAGVTTASNQVPVQFLQHWMNRFITAVTQATKADEFMGRTTVGEWFQEEVVLRVRELTGSVRPYGDHAQPPLAGYNWNYEERTIVRFAQGILTGALEEARLAAIGQKSSAYESDRAALGLAFKLNTNAVAFFGYNLGYNKT